MKNYKLRLTRIMLSAEDNPKTWVEEDLKSKLNGEVVVGYMLRIHNENFGIVLYSILEKYLSSKDSIISLQTLQNAFEQWLESLQEDPGSVVFRNPPIEEWLDSKDNWLKKVSGNLAKTYNRTYDECLSELYYVIMTCYNKQTVYLGSLNYIVTTAHNAIKKEYNYMKNRLTGSHPLAIHLDASPSDFNASLEDSVESFHELIGELDPSFEQLEFEELREAILKDMSSEFSPREIDQILNYNNFLPDQLYRKLLRWRKLRKMEDYK